MICRPKGIAGAIALILAGLCTLAPPARALEFLFDYSYDSFGFFGATQRNALESAASYLESIIGDDFDAITPGGGNTWTANFFHPETLAGQTVDNLAVAADTLLVYAGSSTVIGGLGIAQPGGISSVSGTAAFATQVITRGEGGIITTGTSGDDTEVAPWGGSVSFDRAATWNFDDESGPGAGAGEYDFRTVAMHELIHVLGFGSVDSFNRLVVGGEFTGANAVAVYGGNVPLTATDHFDGISSGVHPGGSSQAALMNEALSPASRLQLTDVDAAALDDIGYDVVPEPTSALLLITAGTALLLRRPRR